MARGLHRGNSRRDRYPVKISAIPLQDTVKLAQSSKVTFNGLSAPSVAAVPGSSPLPASMPAETGVSPPPPPPPLPQAAAMATKMHKTGKRTTLCMTWLRRNSIVSTNF
jgi:hypothetical protein